eukprot:3734394-Rhodomonas_salina.2
MRTTPSPSVSTQVASARAQLRSIDRMSIHARLSSLARAGPGALPPPAPSIDRSTKMRASVRYSGADAGCAAPRIPARNLPQGQAYRRPVRVLQVL